jgi:hypothetical protein
MRYAFTRDDDGHTYLIPAEDRRLFHEMLNKTLVTEDHGDFITRFDRFRVSSAQDYTFTDPRKLGT